MDSMPGKSLPLSWPDLYLLFVTLACYLAGFIFPSPCPARSGIEKKVLQLISSDSFIERRWDRRCQYPDSYLVYLVDNFEQKVELVPEVTTSHGELLKRLLLSGRKDILIEEINSSLEKGLALIIDRLANGGCADAVISSIPGSNYTYAQVSTLLINPVELGPDNIQTYKARLAHLIQKIAFQGFPSTQWLERLDINPAKLMNDTRKIAYISALGHFSVPVILPYGNADTDYKGQPKDVNLLGLSDNSKIFSALDQHGNKVSRYPYSPLSSGSEKASYTMFECPDKQDPFTAHLDIDDDGFAEYSYRRSEGLVYRNDRGKLISTPPPLQPEEFQALINNIAARPGCQLPASAVINAKQFRSLKLQCHLDCEPHPLQSFVWLNPYGSEGCITYEAHCQPKGQLRGTSLIPPLKVKELLPARPVDIDR